MWKHYAFDTIVGKIGVRLFLPYKQLTPLLIYPHTLISLQIAEQVEDDLEAWNQAQRLAYHSSEAAEVPQIN